MEIKCKNNLFMLFMAVMLLQGVSLAFQRPFEETREKWANDRMPPEQVMDAIGIKSGMVIGELGAGRGRYTVHMANRVGKQGKIIANDINEQALAYLRERCQRHNIQNIETLLGKIDDPLFPENSLDMVVMVWVFHMLEQPLPIMKNLRPSLKPGATVVILDPPDEEIDEEIKAMKGKLDPNRPTIKERIEQGAAAGGFELVKILTFLPKDSIYILKVKEK
jgi:ubiquinone/menaquinone biosynthesis C-methylase UbiE